jgi:hypothetical protein
MPFRQPFKASIVRMGDLKFPGIIDLLLEEPMLRRPVGRRLRRALLTRFPFSLIFAEESDAILIVAVAHHKRRPDYWRMRSGG